MFLYLRQKRCNVGYHDRIEKNWENTTADDRYESIIRAWQWNDEVNDFKPDEQRIIKFKAFLLAEFKTRPPNSVIRQLGKLFRWADPDEIPCCFAKLRTRQFSNKEEHFICGYGQIEGSNRWNEYRQKLSSSRKNSVYPASSVIDTLYWERKGYSAKEAIELVSNEQSRRLVKRHARQKKIGYDYKASNPLSLSYWTAKGYTTDEAECLRSPYLQKCCASLSANIERYGEDEGTRRFFESRLARETTIKNKYGLSGTEIFLSSGRCSKQALKVLTPISAWLLQQYQDSKLYIGVDDNREYVINNGKGKLYFYDLTFISPNLSKFIIEYNGSFWHPKSENDSEYEGSRIGIDTKTKWNYDQEKLNAAKARGFEILVLWDDLPPNLNIKKSKEWIIGLQRRTDSV